MFDMTCNLDFAGNLGKCKQQGSPLARIILVLHSRYLTNFLQHCTQSHHHCSCLNTYCSCYILAKARGQIKRTCKFLRVVQAHAHSSGKNLQCLTFQPMIILSNSIRNQDTKMSTLVEFLSDLALLESTPLDMDGRAINLILDMKMQLDEFCADHNATADYVSVSRDGYHIVST